MYREQINDYNYALNAILIATIYYVYMADGRYGIKTSVNAGASFNEVAPDRVPMGTIRQEVGATITRVGMDGKSQTIDANTGDKVYKGDTLKTSDGGSFLVDLVDKTILTGGPNSAVEMSEICIS